MSTEVQKGTASEVKETIGYACSGILVTCIAVLINHNRKKNDTITHYQGSMEPATRSHCP